MGSRSRAAARMGITGRHVVGIGDAESAAGEQVNDCGAGLFCVLQVFWFSTGTARTGREPLALQQERQDGWNGKNTQCQDIVDNGRTQNDAGFLAPVLT